MHHHLIREKKRTQVGLLVEAGDAREVHHMALLVGYGAAAINPYLAFESIEDLIARRRHHRRSTDRRRPSRNYIKALGKGVLKVMSKMGISTVASLHAAPRSSRRSACRSELVDQYFTGTVSRLGGIGLDEIAAEVAARHAAAYPPTAPSRRTASSTSAASTSGAARASPTCSTPRPCSSCSTPPGRGATTSSSSTPSRSTTSAERLMTLRGLFEFAARDARQPVPIDEVEPVSDDRQALLHRRDVLRLDLGRRPTRRSPSR